jgi:hypothetical protein
MSFTRPLAKRYLACNFIAASETYLVDIACPRLRLRFSSVVDMINKQALYAQHCYCGGFGLLMLLLLLFIRLLLQGFVPLMQWLPAS